MIAVCEVTGGRSFWSLVGPSRTTAPLTCSMEIKTLCPKQAVVLSLLGLW
ncbi:hypothetical protein RMSM_03796 [Rhodopirellula maiorica SM1]|uniref:Uncharacterized protein n=1 Tax=Rhodopirellula maiorica SM1 TaxID=1265738 RepID=M5RV94_9BACT|nr:hypothetical protein RMSM_03796 [Rhodopirellula maiorica SM1]